MNLSLSSRSIADIPVIRIFCPGAQNEIAVSCLFSFFNPVNSMENKNG